MSEWYRKDSMDGVKQKESPWYRRDITWLAGLAILKVLIHLPVLTRYGYHHDELYFIACGRHPAFGYVDHPPLVPWIAGLMTSVFGESLFALRILATLSTAASVLMVGLLAKKLGGGRFAQVTACLGMIVAPVFLRTGNMLCLPAFEPLFWILASYMVVKIIQEDNPRLWLWVGFIVGLGLFNKHSMLFFGFGLFIGLLVTPMRKYFKSLWLYAGGVIAFLMLLPNLIWQIINDWPTLSFILNIKAGVMSGISALQFILGQLLYLNPFVAFLWISGLIFFLFSRGAKSYRMLGWIWLSVFILLILTKSKIYYLAPAYSVLMAGGGMALEKWVSKRKSRWLKSVFIILLIIGGLLMSPLSVPYMSIDTTEKYVEAITFGKFKNIFELTGDLRAMFGWEKRVKIVSDVYDSLSPEEQSKAVIWAFQYGNAGAIDLFGKKYGLPNASSLALSYWLWGVPEDKGEVVIAVGIRKNNIEHVFEQVEMAAEVELEHVNPWHTPFTLLICRSSKRPLAEIWK